MSAESLKDSLKNCLINFDRRVDVTDLLQQFDLSYEEVHKILESYLRQQESKGVRYEKRFLVQGLEKGSRNEVYTVVQGEKKLQDWLERLQDAQAALYSVEVSGGSKSPAYIFKPVKRHSIRLENLQQRETHLKARVTENAASVETTKAEPKTKKSTGIDIFAKQSAEEACKSKTASEISAETNKITKKASPEEKKKNGRATGGKKDIGNYFSASNKKDDIKGDKKSVAAKTMQNFQENQKNAEELKVKTKAKAEETIPKRNTKPEINTSVQLFEEESSNASSDEEEKLNALKRDIISSDHEGDDAEAASGSKRRRISDSDEEESEKPPEKLERREENGMLVIDIIENDVADQTQSETYLDEDGFVMTVKAKKSGTTAAAGKRNDRSSSTKNKSPRRSPQKSPPKAAAKASSAGTKTKQANIKNFFNKK